MRSLPATVLNSLPKLLISSHQGSGDILKFNRSKIGGASSGASSLPGTTTRAQPSGVATQPGMDYTRQGVNDAKPAVLKN